MIWSPPFPTGITASFRTSSWHGMKTGQIMSCYTPDSLLAPYSM